MANRGQQYTFQENEWDGASHSMFEEVSDRQPSLRRLRKNLISPRQPLESFQEEHPRNKGGRGIKKPAPKKREQWSHAALRLAIDALDSGHAIGEVSKAYGILRTSLREHYIGKRETKKSEPKEVLTMAEEEDLVHYMEEMVRMSCPLNTTQLKLISNEANSK